MTTQGIMSIKTSVMSIRTLVAHCRVTGGGEPPSELSMLAQQVQKILGEDNPILTGLGGFESSIANPKAVLDQMYDGAGFNGPFSPANSV
jgi:hypothetical protein